MIEWVVVIQPWWSVTLGSKMGKLNIFHQIRPRFIFQYHHRSNINLISLYFSVCPQLDLKMCVSKRMEPLEMLLWTATGQRHNSWDPEHPNTAQLDAEPLLFIPGQIIGLFLPLCRFQPKQTIRGNARLSPAFIYEEFHGWRDGINHLHGCFSSFSVYKRSLVCI